MAVAALTQRDGWHVQARQVREVNHRATFQAHAVVPRGDYQVVYGCTPTDAEAVNLPRVALPDDLQLIAPINIKAQARLPTPTLGAVRSRHHSRQSGHRPHAPYCAPHVAQSEVVSPHVPGRVLSPRPLEPRTSHPSTPEPLRPENRSADRLPQQ